MVISAFQWDIGICSYQKDRFSLNFWTADRPGLGLRSWFPMRSNSGLDIVASNLINLAQGTQTIGGRQVTKPTGSAWDTAGEEGRSAVGGTESMTPTGARSRFRPSSGGPTTTSISAQCTCKVSHRVSTWLSLERIIRTHECLMRLIELSCSRVAYLDIRTSLFISASRVHLVIGIYLIWFAADSEICIDVKGSILPLVFSCGLRGGFFCKAKVRNFVKILTSWFAISHISRNTLPPVPRHTGSQADMLSSYGIWFEIPKGICLEKDLK